MSHNLEPKPLDNIELQVETPTNIICSKCGSDNYIKAGFAYQENKDISVKTAKLLWFKKNVQARA